VPRIARAHSDAAASSSVEPRPAPMRGGPAEYAAAAVGYATPPGPTTRPRA